MSFTPGADQSAAVTKVQDDPRLAPYLVLRVNGVRIAARGGNIGMDDFMKRVDRAHLEPFFRLHRDAHLNIIRNWVGQNTEESFFDLADEYGLMVLSDFWESTQIIIWRPRTRSCSSPTRPMWCAASATTPRSSLVRAERGCAPADPQ